MRTYCGVPGQKQRDEIGDFCNLAGDSGGLDVVVTVWFWIYIRERATGLWGKREGGVTDDSKHFGQKNWRNGTAMTEVKTLRRSWCETC